MPLSASIAAAKFGIYATWWTGDDAQSIAEAALAAKDHPGVKFPAAIGVYVHALKERPESWFMIGCNGIMTIGDEGFDALIDYAKGHGLHVVKDGSVRAYRFSSCERDAEWLRGVFQCR